MSYLAGEFVENLKRYQQELNISDIDVLCIKIAGLCHDLGHGPFSHLFEKQFIPLITGNRKWKVKLIYLELKCHLYSSLYIKHEQASISMLQYLIDDNNLKCEFKANGLEETHIEFIKDLIIGNSEGKDKERIFLYEV